MRLVRKRTLPDGRVEIFTPKMTDGYYTLADRAVDAQHYMAVNQFLVQDLEAVVAPIAAPQKTKIRSRPFRNGTAKRMTPPIASCDLRAVRCRRGAIPPK